jgi:uncharacterized protein
VVFFLRSINQIQHLKDNEKEALISLVEQLFQRYSDALVNITLFGSKARGDFNKESDLDLLIIVKIPHGKYWQYWFSIVDLVGKIELKYGIVTSIIIKDESEYQTLINDSLFLYTNIANEGIPLWTKPQSASMSISG